ncbi:MAG TPA: anaerobic sulfatase maturase [Armatimonadota bacterium]|jgi:uncharacterized protein
MDEMPLDMLITGPGSPRESRLPFNVMAKPAGASCNLDCRYCFYVPKVALYPGSRARMTDDTLTLYVRQMMETHPGPEVPFVWQGGEPTLLGLPFYQRAIEIQRELAPPGKNASNSLQTNGTLLDDDWCAFLKQNRFLVGVSLDGPRELHDAYRVDRLGHGTFESVMRGIRLLQKHSVDFNILCTVHAANGDFPLDVYRFFRDGVGADWVQFIPIVERDADGSVTERSVGPGQFGRFLTGVFDEWVRRDVGCVFIQEFEVALGAWAGRPPGICVHAPTCGANVAMEHNGDVYACDHFVDREHLLGNIRETRLDDLVGLPVQQRFGVAKQATLPNACKRCGVLFACQGGCPKDRFSVSPCGDTGLNYLCTGYKAFFEHVDHPMELMADMLLKGTPAERVMMLLAAEPGPYSAVGRNDPCPCGSGRKFKRCHGV